MDKDRRMFPALPELVGGCMANDHLPESLKEFTMYADADELYALANSFKKVEGHLTQISEPTIYKALLKGAFDDVERFDGLNRPFYMFEKKYRRELSYDELKLFSDIAVDYAKIEEDQRESDYALTTAYYHLLDAYGMSNSLKDLKKLSAVGMMLLISTQEDFIKGVFYKHASEHIESLEKMNKENDDADTSNFIDNQKFLLENFFRI